MKLHNFFEKLRDYPENTKKTIVFSLVGILGVMMLAFWFPYFLKRVDSLSKGLPDMVKLPSVITQSDNLQNQSDPTSQWVMYQNQDYGFSIKHPEDVTLEETKGNETFKLAFNKDEKTLMVITVYQDTKPAYDLIMEKVAVAGKDAKIVRSKNTKNLNCFKIQLENNTITYIIDDDCDSENYQPTDQDNNLLYQLISTFSFTS